MAPIISPFEFDEAVFYGESIQVMCHVPKGDMPLNFIWSFQGKPIKKNDAVVITKLGTRSIILAIPAATENHSGNYTCTASNIVASTNHTATLNVQGTLVILVFSFFYLFVCPHQFLHTSFPLRPKSQFSLENRFS